MVEGLQTSRWKYWYLKLLSDEVTFDQSAALKVAFVAWLNNLEDLEEEALRVLFCNVSFLKQKWGISSLSPYARKLILELLIEANRQEPIEENWWARIRKK